MMISNTDIWIERLSSLHRSQIRKAVSAEGLQLVHYEILQYLLLSNRYSNTAQALTEYLGQTKGSISQSLKFLLDKGYVDRTPDPDDKRYSRLSLTALAKEALVRMNKIVAPGIPDDNESVDVLKDILTTWQKNNQLKAFGQCKTCRHNRPLSGGGYLCDLTEEALLPEETELLCREHQF